MIEFRADGTTVIQFPDGPVTLKSPSWGVYRRMQAERSRIGAEVRARTDELRKELQGPPADDTSEDAVAARASILERSAEIVERANQIAHEALEQTWRLVLFGGTVEGTTFNGLADPKPPQDADDWPAVLFVDAGEFEDQTINGQTVRVRTNPVILDQIFAHLGKAQVSSSTNGSR